MTTTSQDARIVAAAEQVVSLEARREELAATMKQHTVDIAVLEAEGGTAVAAGAGADALRATHAKLRELQDHHDDGRRGIAVLDREIIAARRALGELQVADASDAFKAARERTRAALASIDRSVRDAVATLVAPAIEEYRAAEREAQQAHIALVETQQEHKLPTDQTELYNPKWQPYFELHELVDDLVKYSENRLGIQASTWFNVPIPGRGL